VHPDNPICCPVHLDSLKKNLSVSKVTKMTEKFFKSAINYFNVAGSGQENEYVGQIVEVATYKLRIKRVIAEGMCNLIIYSTSIF
jgi:hypothetical protein